MNILYYDARKVKLPELYESDDDENQDDSHFISIGKESRYRKGHMLDIYVSVVSDMNHKIMINVNEQ